ncbi:hypothetical protein MNBD_CHLOROFLEXI01-3731 [hydrothermal vent metagenome]|uniref:Uncharacterized protein n=1 Tax=hydrothermal vent metagenome TaxID=652676 RepID=A0A3B0VMM4_9ZZZZ
MNPDKYDKKYNEFRYWHYHIGGTLQHIYR